MTRKKYSKEEIDKVIKDLKNIVEEGKPAPKKFIERMRKNKNHELRELQSFETRADNNNLTNK